MIQADGYAAIIERTDTGYSAYPPDLPGVGVAAPTLDAVKALIREAVSLHLAAMREDGDVIPEPTTLVDYVPAA